MFLLIDSRRQENRPRQCGGAARVISLMTIWPSAGEVPSLKNVGAWPGGLEAWGLGGRRH